MGRIAALVLVILLCFQLICLLVFTSMGAWLPGEIAIVERVGSAVLNWDLGGKQTPPPFTLQFWSESAHAHRCFLKNKFQYVRSKHVE